jgi:ribonuclease Y
MEVNTNMIIFIAIAILIGVGLGIFIQRRKNTKQLDDANAEAKEILNQSRREADRIKSEKMLQAKERFIELKSEHEKVIFEREKKISDVESRLRDKENKLNNDLNRNKNLSHSLEQKSESLEKRLENLDTKQKELEASHKIQVEKLETISGLSADEAKKELISSLEKKAESEAMAFAQQSLEEAKIDRLNKKPKKSSSTPFNA